MPNKFSNGLRYPFLGLPYGMTIQHVKRIYGLDDEHIQILKKKFKRVIYMYEPREGDVAQYTDEDAEVLSNNLDGTSDIYKNGTVQTVNNEELS